MALETEKLLKIFLVLVALHSFLVGMGLIFIPLDLYEFFGFKGYYGSFFKIQGGVFHIVMCGAYVPAALNPVRNRIMIRFAIFAKFIATVFLVGYALFVEMVWMVLASGIFDFLMGMILVWFNEGLKKKLDRTNPLG
jgi:hypothetical protein